MNLSFNKTIEKMLVELTEKSVDVKSKTAYLEKLINKQYKKMKRGEKIVKKKNVNG